MQLKIVLMAATTAALCVSDSRAQMVTAAPSWKNLAAERQRQRATYFGRNESQPSPGQITFEFPRLSWKDGELPTLLDEDRYWATMDVNCSAKMGGRSLRPGHYYVGVQKHRDTLVLELYPSDKLRAKQVRLGLVAGKAIRIPLEAQELSGEPRNLAMTCRVPNKKDAPKTLEFALQWGPKSYTAPVEVKVSGQVNVFLTAGLRGRATLAGPVSGDEQRIVTVEFGKPAWNKSRQAAMDSLEVGQRWRLGQNWWTALETNCGLRSGKRSVRAGLYYLMLERGPKDTWNLVLLDERIARKKTMDGFQAIGSDGGTVFPLQVEKSQKVIKKLDLSFQHAGDGKGVVLRIAWGPYRLTAPVDIGD